MTSSVLRRLSVGFVVVAMDMAVWWFGGPRMATPVDENGGVFRLQAPAFYQSAHAEGTAIASLFDDVAGIAAYYAVPGGLNPQTVKGNSAHRRTGDGALRDRDDGLHGVRE